MLCRDRGANLIQKARKITATLSFNFTDNDEMLTIPVLDSKRRRTTTSKPLITLLNRLLRCLVGIDSHHER